MWYFQYSKYLKNRVRRGSDRTRFLKLHFVLLCVINFGIYFFLLLKQCNDNIAILCSHFLFNFNVSKPRGNPLHMDYIVSCRRQFLYVETEQHQSKINHLDSCTVNRFFATLFEMFSSLRIFGCGYG